MVRNSMKYAWISDKREALKHGHHGHGNMTCLLETDIWNVNKIGSHYDSFGSSRFLLV